LGVQKFPAIFIITIIVIILVGLFFYFPEMTSVERVWITLICEHSLLLFKVVLDMILSSTPKEVLPPRPLSRLFFFFFCLYSYLASSSFATMRYLYFLFASAIVCARACAWCS
jgi:hypothetical protein